MQNNGNKFQNKKLGKILSKSKLIEKEYGSSAKKIKNRLDDIKNVDNLLELMKLPGKHHLLIGDRDGQFACNLVHPFRLIYEPDNHPLPIDNNNLLIYSRVTSVTIVEIIEIIDYH